MRIKNGFRSLSYILMGVILVLSLTAYANADESYEELNKEVLKAIDRGLEWLKMQQKADGALHDHPGVAGVALAAFLKHPQNKYAPAKTPFIQKSIGTFLKSYNSRMAVSMMSTDSPLCRTIRPLLCSWHFRQPKIRNTKTQSRKPRHFSRGFR